MGNGRSNGCNGDCVKEHGERPFALFAVNSEQNLIDPLRVWGFKPAYFVTMTTGWPFFGPSDHEFLDKG